MLRQRHLDVEVVGPLPADRGEAPAGAALGGAAELVARPRCAARRRRGGRRSSRRWRPPRSPARLPSIAATMATSSIRCPHGRPRPGARHIGAQSGTSAGSFRQMSKPAAPVDVSRRPGGRRPASSASCRSCGRRRRAGRRRSAPGCGRAGSRAWCGGRAVPAAARDVAAAVEHGRGRWSAGRCAGAGRGRRRRGGRRRRRAIGRLDDEPPRRRARPRTGRSSRAPAASARRVQAARRTASRSSASGSGGPLARGAARGRHTCSAHAARAAATRRPAPAPGPRPSRRAAGARAPHPGRSSRGAAVGLVGAARSSRSSSADRRRARSPGRPARGPARPRPARRSPGAAAAGPPAPGRRRPRPTGSPGGSRRADRDAPAFGACRLGDRRACAPGRRRAASRRRRTSAAASGATMRCRMVRIRTRRPTSLGAPPERLVPGVLDQHRAAQRGGERVDRGLDVGRVGHWPPPGSGPAASFDKCRKRRAKFRAAPKPRGRPLAYASRRPTSLTPEARHDRSCRPRPGCSRSAPRAPRLRSRLARADGDHGGAGRGAGRRLRRANLIGGREVRTGRNAAGRDPARARPPDRPGALRVGSARSPPRSTPPLAASSWWGRLPWEERAAPFLRAADMLEHGPWRDRLNAATMLELSKTTYQADIDAACETIDFIRANVKNMLDMYDVQPGSLPGMWNQAEYRPLEGFVFAVTPFNFTCMNNLAFGPAVLGNTVVWKPAESASLVAHLSMELLREAGLPDGVINVVYGNGPRSGRSRSATGTSPPCTSPARPRRSSTSGGPSARTSRATATTRGWSARRAARTSSSPIRQRRPRRAGRGLRPRRLRVPGPEVLGGVPALRAAQPVAGAAGAAGRAHRVRGRRRPDVPQTYVGAVINARQHAKHVKALARARAEGLVVVGGSTDESTGWFVDPTVLEVSRPGTRHSSPRSCSPRC